MSESLIDEAWAFGPDTDRYMLGYHRPNYLLAARYTDDVNQAPFSPIFGAADSDEALDSTEARFQLSFKGRAWSTDGCSGRFAVTSRLFQGTETA